MIDIISILYALGFITVPPLILTLYTYRNGYTFLGYLSIFMFVGSSSEFAILPNYFMYISILITAVYLYKVVIK